MNQFLSVITPEGWKEIQRMASEPGMTMETLWKKLIADPVFDQITVRWQAGFNESDREELKAALANLPLDWTAPYQNNIIRNVLLPAFKQKGISIPLTGRTRGVQITRPSRLVKQAIEDLEKNLEYQSRLLSQSLDSQLDHLKTSLRMLALNLPSPRRILVYGTSGVGKTYTVTTYLDSLIEAKKRGELPKNYYPEYHRLTGNVLTSEVVVDPKTGERKRLSGLAKLRGIFERHSTYNSPILIADDIDLNEGQGQMRSFLLSILDTNQHTGALIPMGIDRGGKYYYKPYEGRLVFITNRSNFDQALADRFQIKLLIQSRSSDLVKKAYSLFLDPYQDELGRKLYDEIFEMLNSMAPGLILTNRNIESILNYAVGLVQMREAALTEEDAAITDDMILQYVYQMALNAARGDFARPNS